MHSIFERGSQMRIISAVALLIGSTVFAAPAGSSSVTYSEPSSVANTMLSVGPALEIQGSDKALPGFNFTAVTSAASGVPLYVGAEAGFFFTNDPKFNGVLPVMGTMFYEFPTGAATRPFLGVSAGPVFGVGENQTSARFGMLLKPGLNIKMAPTVGLTIESRIGVFGSQFVYLPQVAAHFTL